MRGWMLVLIAPAAAAAAAAAGRSVSGRVVRRRIAAAAAAASALCVAAALAAWGLAGPSPRAGAIVFASQRSDGGWELYAVSVGGGLRQLTAHSPLAYGAPAWSPNGRTIAFRRASDLALFLADSETGRLRQLPVFTSNYLDNVSWAPDGARLVYSTEDAHGRNHLWVTSDDGTHRRRLTSSSADDFAPAWSPDGKTIASKRRGSGRSAESAGGFEESSDVRVVCRCDARE